MAEVPEEIVVALDVDDKASQKIRSFGGHLTVLGANISYVAKAFGVQNQAVDAVVGTLVTLGHITRAAASAKYILIVATNILNAVEAQGATAAAANAAVKSAQIPVNASLTASNYSLAASFAAVNAAMGPVGWLALGASVVGGALAGAYMGGAFGGSRGQTTSRIGEGINISIGRADFRTIADAEKEVKNMATMVNSEFRRYKH